MIKNPEKKIFFEHFWFNYKIKLKSNQKQNDHLTLFEIFWSESGDSETNLESATIKTIQKLCYMITDECST